MSIVHMDRNKLIIRPPNSSHPESPCSRTPLKCSNQTWKYVQNLLLARCTDCVQIAGLIQQNRRLGYKPNALRPGIQAQHPAPPLFFFFFVPKHQCALKKDNEFVALLNLECLICCAGKGSAFGLGTCYKAHGRNL